MTAPPDRLPEHLAERRKNPRAESSARYKRLREEAGPPPAIGAAIEGLFRFIDGAVRGIRAAIADLRARSGEGVRRIPGKEVPRL